VEAVQSAVAAVLGLLVLHLLTRPAHVDWVFQGGVVLAMSVGGFVGSVIRRRRRAAGSARD
jgi:hypothetical protein